MSEDGTSASEAGERLIEAGLSRVRARQWRELLRDMKAARARYPTSAWPWVFIQAAYLGMGDVDNAIRCGVAGLRIDGRSPRLWEGMARSFWLKGDTRATRTAIAAIREHGGSARLADSLALRVASARGEDAEAVRLGNELFGRERHGPAGHARAGVVEPPREPDASRSWLEGLHDLGRTHRDEAAELPLDRDGLVAWAAALLRITDASGARDAADMLIADNEADPSGWTVAAAAEAARGDFDAACEAQRRALERSRSAEPEMWHALVTYQEAAGRMTAAVRTGTQALREHTRSAPLWARVASALERSGLVDAALYAATLASVLSPDDPHIAAARHALVERASERARREADELRDQGAEAHATPTWKTVADRALAAMASRSRSVLD